MVTKDLSTNVDKLTKDVSDPECCLEYSQQDISELQDKITSQYENLHTKDKNISDMEKMKSKMVYLENESSRNNIIINSIPEDYKEAYNESKPKSKPVLQWVAKKKWPS